MSHIRIASHGRSPRRAGRTGRASFGLFALAVVIAVSAAVVRIRKDTAVLSDPAVPSHTVTQPSVGGTVPADSGTEPTRTQRRTQPSRADRTEEQPAQAPVDGDEWEDSEQTLAIQTMGKNRTSSRPVGGAVIKAYSMDALVYSRTMGDWRTHEGLDLAVSEGEIVRSAGEGTVTDVASDPLYGVTVVVNQNDGLLVYYRGLAADTAVRKGENVSSGTTLGTAAGVPCEKDDGLHLHLEVRQDGRLLDPAEALGIR